MPILGHLLEFGKGPIDLLTRARAEKGDLCAFRLFNREFLFLSGVEGNEALFRAEEDALNFREPYKLTVPIFGKGVVYDAHPAQMSEQFGFLMNSLRDTRMRLYPELVAQEVEAFVSGWGEEGELELPDMTKELTTYTSSRCLLGREFREKMSGEFAHVYHDLEAGLIPIAFLYPYLPLPAFRRRDRARPGPPAGGGRPPGRRPPAWRSPRRCVSPGGRPAVRRWPRPTPTPAPGGGERR